MADSASADNFPKDAEFSSLCRNHFSGSALYHKVGFGGLYELYYSKILSYVYRRTMNAALAEELTSNTFFKALRALPEYEHRGHFSAWLYRIATNEIKAHRRTASSRAQKGSGVFDFDR